MKLLKKTFLFCVMLLPLTSCMHTSPEFYCTVDPVLTSINIIDRNGLTETINNPERLNQYALVNFLQPQPYQKVLRIYSRNMEGSIPACITSYHSNGSIHKYLDVVNSRAYGTYKEWFPNGQLHVSAQVISGTADVVDGAEKSWLFDGCNQAWNEEGSLEATIYYEKGILEGVSTYYHSNGAAWKIVPYKQNQIDGTMEIHLADGQLLQTTGYKNGVKEGKSIRYWTAQTIAADEEYCEGLLATGRYYNQKGELLSEINRGQGVRSIFGKDRVVETQEYKNGVIDGEVRQLDRFGRTSCLYHVKNGCKRGEEINYYEGSRFQETLLPKLSIMWFEDKIQGIVRTWYDNEVLESQREISNNKKSGHITAWYRDGSLMLIEEYEQDQLVRGEYYVKGEKFPVTTVDEGNGTVSLFNPEGSLIQRIEYKNGKPCLDE